MSDWEMSDREISDREMYYCEPWWCIKKGGKIQTTPGVPEGGYLPDGAGAAGVHLGRCPSIRSSPEGQDEAIDTPTTLLPGLQVQILRYVTFI